jgi:actin-related protein
MSKSVDPLALSKDKKIPVVLDIGTAYTKCGFAGESSPRHIIPTEVRPHHLDRVTLSVSTLLPRKVSCDAWVWSDYPGI